MYLFGHTTAPRASPRQGASRPAVLVPTTDAMFHGSYMTPSKSVAWPLGPAKAVATLCGRAPAVGLEHPHKLPPRIPQSSREFIGRTQAFFSGSQMFYEQQEPV